MSNAIKCIVRQGWTTRDADGNLISRRDYVYVTNEGGTPHVYNSIAEARADIRGNYGRDANRAGILHTRSVDDYTGHVHEGYVYIVREDTDEFAAATADAKTETAAAEPIIYATERIEATEATRKGYAEKVAGYVVAELMDAYVKATGTTWSKYVETHDDEQAQALYRVASVEIIPEPERPAGYETASPEDYAAVAAVVAILAADATEQPVINAMNDANEAMGEASDALSKTEAAALEYDADASAAFAAETRAAADRAEQAADRAWSAATTPPTCTLADIASEDAASARAYADRATETAKQCARELEQRAEIIAQIEDPQHREYIRATAEAHYWTPEETCANVNYYAANRAANAAARALLAEYAETTGRSIEQDDDEYLAAHRVARDEVTGASDRATEYDREIVAAIVERIAQAVRDDIPTGPENYRPTYQRAELLAYLGEPDDYDVTAIEHDATAYDAATGRTVWAVDAETLAVIAERHQLQFYAPAF
jgi:hypothetical protein